MSKKKYDYALNKVVGCNKTRGWLLTDDQIVAVRFYLYLARGGFLRQAKYYLRQGMPRNVVLHEFRKYKEVVSLYDDLLNNLKPYSYVRE